MVEDRRMPFPSQGLDPRLENSLRKFVIEHDFRKLYKDYFWEKDTWKAGFPNILKLELQTSTSAKNNKIERNHIQSIISWGRLRNPKRFESSDSLQIHLYDNNEPTQQIQVDPSTPLEQLRRQTKGIGPTYLSKILRFGLPLEYGALDSRIVRIIGIGDNCAKRTDWLALNVKNYEYGWYIPEHQRAWPGEYSKWINILRFFSNWLNNNNKLCPHPQDFVTYGLRKEGIWTCADVEMALFSYASEYV